MGKFRRVFENSVENDLLTSNFGNCFLEHYEFLEKIHESWLNQIFIIKSKASDKVLILKAIDKDSDYSYDLEAIKKINHENVVKIIDIQQTERYIYIIKEYIKGSTLEERISQVGPLPETEAIDIAITICDIFEYFHSFESSPLIYRDLKPANLIINDDRCLKLIDLDSIRQYKNSSKKDTIYIGTPGFASPEQFGFSQTDERSDIFTLGATLFYIITGKMPTSDRLKAKNGEVGVSENLFEIIEACTSFNPDKRYQTATELRKDLVSLKKSLSMPQSLREKREESAKTKNLQEDSKDMLAAEYERIKLVSLELQQRLSKLETENGKLTTKVETILMVDEEKTKRIEQLEYNNLNMKNRLTILGAGNNVNIKYADSGEVIDNRVDMMIKISAKPEKGFHYAYFLYIPQYLSKNTTYRLLVETNNSYFKNDDKTMFEKDVKNMIEKSPIRKIAQNIGSPLLMPAFPRPESTLLYTHELSRGTMEVKEGEFRRIDLQLIAMIKDAQRVLDKNNIHIYDKVFMNGIGASAKFSNRFTIFHPEQVRAVVAGGMSMPMLPVDKYDNVSLNFPLGTADIRELTGVKFDWENYKSISQFMYLGALDTNDETFANDCYTSEEQGILHSLFGSKILERWNKLQSIINPLGMNIQFGTYKEGHHNYNDQMIEDIIDFFLMNTDNTPMKTIVHG